MRAPFISRLLTLLLFITGAQALRAQVDPHFTQYYVYPSWLNPALTGAFDGDYRISGIYRNQWGNISKPFSTVGLGGEIVTNNNVNLGLNLLNQTAGDGGYYYTTAYANIAYTGVRFGPNENHHIVMGLQLGMIRRGFNASKFTFGDQWDPITGFNPGSSTDGFNKTKTTSFDAGAGVLYFDATPGKMANVYAGFSVSHLTKPKDYFSSNANAQLPMRYTGHAGVRLTLSEVFSVTPNVLYTKQGTAEEKMAGAYVQLNAAPGTDVMLGANYRINDAISPFVGFTHNNMVLGLSYDVNTSELGKMAHGSNSFELSLSITGRKKIKTPEEHFICPRL
ncbi:MAG: PorP/SprF family type IX secretion system membrane protein [Niastella sp.]|uniref:PorP/SprF family type IX secretion system membrane protein n=1 Tax=Niastella sp. TaxID=1869183 RepID=UPI00389B0BFB